MIPRFTIYRTRHSITTTCTTCDEYEVARRDEAIERWQRRHRCKTEKESRNV